MDELTIRLAKDMQLLVTTFAEEAKIDSTELISAIAYDIAKIEVEDPSLLQTEELKKNNETFTKAIEIAKASIIKNQ